MSNDAHAPRLCYFCDEAVHEHEEVTCAEGWAHQECLEQANAGAETVYNEQVRDYNRSRGV